MPFQYAINREVGRDLSLGGGDARRNRKWPYKAMQSDRSVVASIVHVLLSVFLLVVKVIEEGMSSV
jgi:hypothetical protein